MKWEQMFGTVSCWTRGHIFIWKFTAFRKRCEFCTIMDCLFWKAVPHGNVGKSEKANWETLTTYFQIKQMKILSSFWIFLGGNFLVKQSLIPHSDNSLVYLHCELTFTSEPDCWTLSTPSIRKKTKTKQLCV